LRDDERGRGSGSMKYEVEITDGKVEGIKEVTTVERGGIKRDGRIKERRT
jgi:hypothetical protein